jgi:hypothetical protein
MASFNPPSIHFDNINFNESHFTDNQNRDLTLQRMMSVFQNLNQIGLTTDSNTKVVLNEQPIQQQEEGTTAE